MEDGKGSSSAETISPCVSEDSPASSTTCRSSLVAPQLPSEPPSPLQRQFYVYSVNAVRSQSSVRRPLAHRAAYLWHGLPTAAKATLILAVASTVLLVAYGITAVSLRDHDEEAHISTVIIIISLFVLYAVFDAVIRENTLQLVSAIVLSALSLARVLWFISTRPDDTVLLPLKVIWGALIVGVQAAFILTALMSCRQFGWRIYSRLGVDFRSKDAEMLQRRIVTRNAFSAVVKLDFAFLITVTAMGIGVSMEHRHTVEECILIASISTMVVGTIGTALGVWAAKGVGGANARRRLLFFDCLAPICLIGPIIMIVLYEIEDLDVANARISILIGCSVFMALRVAMWIMLHVISGSDYVGLAAGAFRSVRTRPDAASSESGDPDAKLLAALHEGAWLGKPAPRNSRKMRFFQLSNDNSTLRWGWQKFVRLYYVEEVVPCRDSLTLTLTFLLDPELTLKFPDLATLDQWQSGLEHALKVLLRPDGAPGSHTAAIAALAAGASSAIAPIKQLPLRQQDWGGKPSPRGVIAEDASAIEDGTLSGPPKLAALKISGESGGGIRHSPDSRSSSAWQLQKRQRMASFLTTAAAAVGRLQSPGAWLSFRQRGTSASADLEDSLPVSVPDDPTPLNSQLSDVFTPKPPRPAMVTIGTQTEEEEEERGSAAMAGSIDLSLPPSDEAGLAAQYAALMAAAAAAGSAGSGSAGSSSLAFPSPACPARSPHASKELPRTPFAQAAPRFNLPASSHSDSPPHPLSPFTPSPSGHFSGASTAFFTPGLTRGPSSTPSPAPPAIPVDVVDFEELTLGRLLGSGSEGAVYAAWYLETPVAVKRFDRVEDSLHEVGMYLGVGSHDNVVALRALCQHEGAIYLVLEYCPRGTLDAMLHHSAPQQWDPTRLLPLVRSIARGMHHLHARGIVHRDLKPANIFVGHGQTMKVGDFGMSRYVGPPPGSLNGAGSSPDGPPPLVRLSPGVIGTTQYAAPELINEALRPARDSDADWAMKVDVWSFGVTLWEIMERRRPFEGASHVAVHAMWLNTPYQARMPPVKVPEGLDAAGMRVIRGLSDLVEECTRLDPLGRPTFGGVLRRLKALSRGGER